MNECNKTFEVLRYQRPLTTEDRVQIFHQKGCHGASLDIKQNHFWLVEGDRGFNSIKSFLLVLENT